MKHFNDLNPVANVELTKTEEVALAHMLVERMSRTTESRKLLQNDSKDWQPVAGHCHANVAHWVLMHPEYTAVRGWVDMSSAAIHPAKRFIAHSLVSDVRGCLFEITPNKEQYQRDFIRHPGTDEDFARFMLNEHHMVECDTHCSEVLDAAITQSFEDTATDSEINTSESLWVVAGD